MEDELKCPKCRSTHVSANKKGFSGRNAAVGAILTGGVGLLAGTVGSNKVRITCLMCGFEFEPGAKAVLPVSTEPTSFKELLKFIIPFALIVLVFFLILHFVGFFAALIFGIIVLVVAKIIFT